MADLNLNKQTNSYANVSDVNQRITPKCEAWEVFNNTDQSLWISIDSNPNEQNPATVGGLHCVEVPMGRPYKMCDEFPRPWSIHVIGSGVGTVSVTLVGVD